MILLDTHVWLWLALNPDRLSRRAASAIRRAERGGGLGVSILSVWESAWLVRRGRLRVKEPLGAWLTALARNTKVEIHALSVEICALAAELPESFPSDPVDRLLVATAVSLETPLVTADNRLIDLPALRSLW